MAAAKWPVYYYNAKGEFRVCDNPEQVEAAKKAGFKPTPPKEPIEFPVKLYDRDGNTKSARNPEEKKDLLDKGYSEDYIPAKEAPAQALTVDKKSSLESETIRAFMAEIGSLRERLDAAETRLDAVEAAATEPKKTKKADDPKPAA